MPLDALALALGAAVLHALWNLLLARERDTEAATAVALISLVAVLLLPAALTWRVESAAVPYVIGSAALELAYVGLLAAASTLQVRAAGRIRTATSEISATAVAASVSRSRASSRFQSACSTAAPSARANASSGISVAT